jgi:hypothetical protein
VRNVVVTRESDRNRLRDRPESDDLETLAANWPANFGGNVPPPRRHDRLGAARIGAGSCGAAKAALEEARGTPPGRCCTSMAVHYLGR